jgi:hypothetical protein
LIYPPTNANESLNGVKPSFPLDVVRVLADGLAKLLTAFGILGVKVFPVASATTLAALANVAANALAFCENPRTANVFSRVAIVFALVAASIAFLLAVF